ncbi:Tat pathway signal sequence domain protein [Streptomyces sp. NPDC059582]|uniref:Tat pathway signal sequence domain protein n=1 Tax=Streptomyces sp. NPDC059582 TaxID=3346875 RepID=UPI0036BBCAE8
MSGVGPVEPGEGTRARKELPAHPVKPRGRLARHYAEHRRAALATLTAVALLAGSGYVCETRQPRRQQASPAPPFPAQTVEVTYLGGQAAKPGAPPKSFGFEVLLSVVDSGPPVTVTRVAQPYAGLALTSAPLAPFRTESGSTSKIAITMHVTECGKVPRNAGLPFLDVTLRNVRAIQVQSFILGPRYAHDLSEALQVACSNESR